jgi:hypothetical protein
MIKHCVCCTGRGDARYPRTINLTGVFIMNAIQVLTTLGQLALAVVLTAVTVAFTGFLFVV